MFRVLFRVIKICIHIKESLSLEFVFRKGNDSIVSKDLYPLIDGVSNINTTTEFLITKVDPVFELHVNFTFKKVKRQAGFIQINLKDWLQGGSYQEIRKLENAPGGKALIQFGFIFFDAGVSPLSKSIQSFQVFQKTMNEQHKQKIAQQNLILGEKLKDLINLKESLTDQKQTYSRMEVEFEKFEAEIDEEVNFQEKRMDQAKNMLREEQEKQAFLKALVEKSGSEHLMNYMKELNQAEVKIETEPSQNSQDLS